MKLRNKFRVTVENRKKIGGYLFTSPFVIGFLLFFLYPFVQTLVFSFNRLELSADGYSLHWVGLENYNYALLVDLNFRETFVETLGSMVAELPMILAFSLFAAVILNQKFRGRGLARVIFFLPVIYGAGVVLKMESTDFATVILESKQSAYMFSGDALRTLLSEIRFFPEQFVEYIMTAVEAIPNIIRSSGIQILIFLAGLQSISPSVYEAARVEGATAWESFWLITVPMISPLIITNTVYTVIDSLIAADNDLVNLIRNETFTGRGFGTSSAMATLYFLAITIILLIVFKILDRYVFYHD